MFSNFIPNKIITVRPRQAPWITQSIKNFIMKKSRAYKTFISNCRPEHRLEAITNMIALDKLLILMQSFLSDRKQRTVLNGETSTWGTISAGVPQGSILGPLLFLIYINDLIDGLRCNVKLFADDPSFFTVVYDPHTAALDINHDLNLIKLWAHNWRMSINLCSICVSTFSVSLRAVMHSHAPFAFVL